MWIINMTCEWHVNDMWLIYMYIVPPNFLHVHVLQSSKLFPYILIWKIPAILLQMLGDAVASLLKSFFNLPSSAKLISRAVEDVCTRKQEIMGSNPARIAGGFFFPTDTQEAPRIQSFINTSSQGLKSLYNLWIYLKIRVCIRVAVREVTDIIIMSEYTGPG